MGMGHLTRCLALARELRLRGVRCVFISRRRPGDQLGMLSREGFEFVPLSPAQLDVPEEEDAAETAAVLPGNLEWLIVDHYGLGIEWERRCGPLAERLMVIDDLADRPHHCDLLLDQNFTTDAGRYSNLVPDHCRRLIGPRFALLRPEYREIRTAPRRVDGVYRLFVFFGGSDLPDMTRLALQAVSGGAKDLRVDVLIGANHPRRAELERRAGTQPQTRVLEPRPHLADIMEQAHLSLGGGGVTLWERMCMGLPSLVISIAENQRPACTALDREGLIRYLGPSDHMTAEAIAEGVAELRADPEALQQMALRGQLLCDGRGAQRVAELLAPSASESLCLRRTRKEDILTYFEWANDPSVRQQAIRPEPIPWEQHEHWFQGKLEDADTEMFVLEAGGLPVGQIRFDWVGKKGRISYSLDPLVRGRGWGRELVRRALRTIDRNTRILVAEVKTGNHPSRAVFEKLGFQRQRRPQEDELVIYRMNIDRSVGRNTG
jgi:UDP-2,4-diacetamido-2,4,6-trideoxy-beta-L-altropyranose hydrolase